MSNDLARKATERIESEIFDGSLSVSRGIAIASIIRDTYAQQGENLLPYTTFHADDVENFTGWRQTEAK